MSRKNLATPLSILFGAALIALGIYFGSQRGGPSTGGVLGGDQPAPDQGQEAPQQARVSIDDDAILGDKDKATVAIVEFSDYECPFCKRFRDETLDQIKKDYVDTGKAVFVYRDLPLSFHNPAAEREAMAAECAKDQAGDEKYYEYHDKLYAATPGNGTGIKIDKLAELAGEIGLDGPRLRECVESGKFKDEVAGDASDASAAGINGTPGFVIGRLDDSGDVDGVIVSGAQPYSVFQAAIEEQLQ